VSLEGDYNAEKWLQ